MTRDILVTEYTAETRGFRRGAQVYDRTLARQERLTNTRLTRIDKRWERSTRSILNTRTALYSIGSVIGAFEARKYAEQWRNVERRLKSIGVTGRAAKQELVDLAIRTRGSMVATAEAVQRMAKSTDSDFANASRRVETLQKLLTFGGASGTERNSVSLQLGQALKSGQLSGDEYRSISENAPVEFLDALAEAAGIARSELKAFAQDQNLVTSIVLEALDGLAVSADENFSSMAVSGEEAVAVLNTGLASYIGRLDEAVGATATINGVIQSFGEYLAQSGEGAETFAAALDIGTSAAFALAGSRGVGAVVQSLRKSAEARRLDVVEAERQQVASRKEITSARLRLNAANKHQRVVHEAGRASSVRTKADKRQTAAVNNLAAAEARLTVATGAVTAAQKRLSVAARITAGTMKSLRGVMAFFGGPIGLAITGITIAFGLMGAAGETAAQRLERLTDVSGELQTATDNAAFAQEALQKALADRAAGSLVAAEKIVAATKQEFEAKKALLRIEKIAAQGVQAERVRELAVIEERLRIAQNKVEHVRGQPIRGNTDIARQNSLDDNAARLRRADEAVTALKRDYDALLATINLSALGIAASNEIIGASFDDVFDETKPEKWAAKVDAAREVASRFVRQNMSDEERRKEVLAEVAAAREVLIQQYGEESAEVAMLDSAMQGFRAELQNTKSDTDSLTNAAITLRNALAALGSVHLNLDDRLSVARSRLNAARRGLGQVGVNAAGAGQAEALKLIKAGATPDVIAAAYEKTVALNAELGETNALVSRLLNPKNSGGSGGGGRSGSEIAKMESEVLRFIESMMTVEERRAKRLREAIQLRGEFVQTYGIEDLAVKQLDEAIVRLRDNMGGLHDETEEFFKTLSGQISNSIVDWKGWGNFVGTLLASFISQYGAQFFTALFTPGAQAGNNPGTTAGNWVTGQVAHQGGIAGGAGPRRTVPASVFHNAQKYHGGGIAGLRPNEVPAILERGEVIIPNGAKMKSSGGIEVHIHENASDGQHRVEKSGGRVDVFLKRAVSDVIGSGGADGALRNRFGVRPAAKGA